MQTSDQTASVQFLRDIVAQFVSERQWEKFHQPKNLAMSIAIEAGELMEHFQWLTPEEVRDAVAQPSAVADMGEELADVMCYCIAMANALDIDITQTIQAKMIKNRIKYPA